MLYEAVCSDVEDHNWHISEQITNAATMHAVVGFKHRGTLLDNPLHCSLSLRTYPYLTATSTLTSRDQNKRNPKLMQVKLASREWMALVWWKWIYGKVGQSFLCLLVHFTPAPACFAYISFLGHSFCFLSFLCYLILLIIHLYCMHDTS